MFASRVVDCLASFEYASPEFLRASVSIQGSDASKISTPSASL
jgi:hypothetical protein